MPKALPKLPRTRYPWAVGNDRVRMRYVNYNGEGRIFIDTMDERGRMRVFRVRLEEMPEAECRGEC